MGHRFLAWLLAGVCFASLSISHPPLGPFCEVIDSEDEPSATSSKVDYNRDILPILSNKCFTCHGPDNPKPKKAPLRLDLREIATKPRKSGDVPIVPGKASDSEVVRRIYLDEGSERMPPIKGGKPLTDAEKALIKRWIDEGAEYKPHWAFTKIERPSPPKVKDRTWGKNEIDAFILHRLETAGLKPSPPADRVTLIR